MHAGIPSLAKPRSAHLSFTVRSRSLTRASIPKEGAVFLVPLTPSNFAAGVLARKNGRGGAFGYFFGPRLRDGASLDVGALTPARAVLVCKFGDYGLRTGRWTTVGGIPGFARKVWVLPKFHRAHDSQQLVYVTEYNDSLSCRSEILISREDVDVSNLPYDSQLGSGVVEHMLSALI